jgi:chromate transport protein ChrA
MTKPPLKRTRFFALGLVPMFIVLWVFVALYPQSPHDERMASIVFAMAIVSGALALMGAATGLLFSRKDLSRFRAVVAGFVFSCFGALAVAIDPSPAFMFIAPVLAFFGAWIFTWVFGELLGLPESNDETPA